MKTKVICVNDFPEQAFPPNTPDAVVEKELEDWEPKYPEVVRYKGIPLCDFTKDELVIILSKITHGLLNKEEPNGD